VNVVRTIQYRRRSPRAPSKPPSPNVRHTLNRQPRRILRITFGIIWIFDGLLQAQTSMRSACPAPSSPRRRLIAGLGAAPGQLGRDHLGRPSDHRGCRHRMDPGRHRNISPGRPARVRGRGRLCLSAGWASSSGSSEEAFGNLFGQGNSWLFGFPGAGAVLRPAGVLIALRGLELGDPTAGQGAALGTVCSLWPWGVAGLAGTWVLVRSAQPVVDHRAP